MRLYKCLDAQGRSQYQHHQWPVPGGTTPEEYFLQDDDTGPGEWVELPKPADGGQQLSLCDWGLHGWRTLTQARAQANSSYGYIYEMELSGTVKAGTIVRDEEKACGYRARLLKLVQTPESATDGDGPTLPGHYVWQ